MVVFSETHPFIWEWVSLLVRHAFFVYPNMGKIVDASECIEYKGLQIDCPIKKIVRFRWFLGIRWQSREYAINAVHEHPQTPREPLLCVLTRFVALELLDHVALQQLLASLTNFAVSIPEMFQLFLRVAHNVMVFSLNDSKNEDFTRGGEGKRRVWVASG